MTMVRLQKFLADAGVASRRTAERFIVEGRISVNGSPVRQLGAKVDPDHDQVAVDGKPVRGRRKLYVAVHKPRGYVCTRRDPEERKVIGELLPREWAHLHTVGRLDRDSEGLIFLTNDGDFTLRLTHPRYGVVKRYRVEVEGRLAPADAARLERGIEDAGERLAARRARLLNANNSHSVMEVELTEGKNRELRRMFAALDRPVVRLQRLQIGPIKLGELPSGKWRTLTDAEINSLLRSP
jgi:23S rRNA pseudouridine2605 synthase